MKKPKKQYNLKNDRSANTKLVNLLFSPELHKKTKIIAINKGLTMSEYIRDLIEKDIERELKGE